MDESREAVLEGVAFVGETLAPLFLNDPQTGSAGAVFQALMDLDMEAAAAEWPFVDAEEAARDLRLMKEDLAEGPDGDALTWEYRRLFIGPARKPAPPWGSVYTDRECVMFGKTTLALRAWMRERGIERLGDDKTPEDHIGLMLALMAWIAENRPEDLDEYLRLHLFTWSSHFLEQLAQAANHPFYQGLARLTQSSLEGIQTELALDVVCPRFYR